jgi:hypothetical protein
MKLNRVFAVSLLSLTLALPALAQDERHDQEDQKEKPAEAKKAQPEKAGKPGQQEKNGKPEDRKEDKSAQQARPEAKPAHEPGHATARRIPDDRFKANFGREHSFRVSQGDYRNHRFQYGGYWFGFAAPWPSNWLYTQDVFVVEIGGVYYLCNAAFPGVNVALNVTM